MFIPNEPFFQESGVHGPMPVVWYGVGAPDGDAYPWMQAPIGSQYIQKVITSGAEYTRQWSKVVATSHDTDWLPGAGSGYGCIIQRVTIVDDFTDGEGATGTLVLDQTLPAGATVVNVKLVNVTGTVGESTAVMTVGDGSTADRYNTGTPSIAANAAFIDMGAVTGTAYNLTAISITLTITEDDDFTDITAGAFTIYIHYYI